MSFVVTTGCMNSGWEDVIPFLQSSGFEPNDGLFKQWHDELFAAVGVKSPLYLKQTIAPSPELTEKARLLSNAEHPGTVLLNDSRSLWLLDFWAKQLPDARFLLFYTSAKNALAHAIDRGEEVNFFMDAWRHANQQLMGFQRRHRGRTLLLNTEAAVQNPQALTEASKRIDLALQAPDKWSEPPSSSGALLHFMADNYVSNDASIESLQLELEASAYPLGDILSGDSLSLEDIYQDYRRNLTEREQLKSALEESKQQQDKLAEENELLLLQLHQVQEELETVFQARQQVEQSARERESQAQALQLELEAIKQEQEKGKEQAANNQDLLQENELLLLQLHQVQEELETYFLKYQELASSAAQTESAQLESNNEQTPDMPPVTPKTHKRGMSSLWPFGRSRKQARRVKRQVALLRASGIFDEQWYKAEYPDVAAAGMDPIVHYLRYGAEEGRNPSPIFDTQHYVDSNPDVQESGINPLIHYVKFGKDEGRSPSAAGYGK